MTQPESEQSPEAGETNEGETEETGKESSDTDKNEPNFD